MFLFARCLHFLVKIFIKVKSGSIKLMLFNSESTNCSSLTTKQQLNAKLLIFSFPSTTDKHFESTFEQMMSTSDFVSKSRQSFDFAVEYFASTSDPIFFNSLASTNKKHNSTVESAGPNDTDFELFASTGKELVWKCNESFDFSVQSSDFTVA